jgi:hypothetical protein
LAGPILLLEIVDSARDWPQMAIACVLLLLGLVHIVMPSRSTGAQD